MKKTNMLAGALLLVLSSLPAPAAMARAEKVDVCHNAGPHGKVVVLNVSVNAAKAHERHGDAIGEDCAAPPPDGDGGDGDSSFLPACITTTISNFNLVGHFDPTNSEFVATDEFSAKVTASGDGHALLILDAEGNEFDSAYSANWSVTQLDTPPGFSTTGVFGAATDFGAIALYSIVPRSGQICSEANSE